jgi:hypothetical protein
MTDERLERLRERMDAPDAEKKSEEKPALPARLQVARFLTTALFFVGIIVVARLGVSIWRDYNGWRTAGNDNSAREAYITFLEVDVVLLAVAIAAFIGAAMLVSWWSDRPD